MKWVKPRCLFRLFKEEWSVGLRQGTLTIHCCFYPLECPLLWDWLRYAQNISTHPLERKYSLKYSIAFLFKKQNSCLSLMKKNCFHCLIQVKWKVLTPFFFYHEFFFFIVNLTTTFYYRLVLNLCDIVLVLFWILVHLYTSVNLLGYFLFVLLLWMCSCFLVFISSDKSPRACSTAWDCWLALGEIRQKQVAAAEAFVIGLVAARVLRPLIVCMEGMSTN